jgi:type IV pilus assembly protein PilW
MTKHVNEFPGGSSPREIKYAGIGLRSQSGLSLVELMVAMVVGLLMLAAIGAVVVNTSATHRELQAASRLVENGRYAMQLLIDEIHHAGFYGEFFDLQAPPAALPSPCLSDPVAAETPLNPSMVQAMSLPIQGYNAPVTSPIAACLSAADHLSGTDILVLRRASTAVTSITALTPARVYLQATNDGVVLAAGPEPNPLAPETFTLKKKGGAAAADVREYRADIYFISPCQTPVAATCDASADAGSPLPTLKRLRLVDDNGGTTIWISEPLAAGIENMQIDYGIDDNGDGSPDRFVTSPADTTEWSNVLALEVHLLARTAERTAGYTDAKSYDLGEAGSVSPGGNFKRRVFTAFARAVNPASRREAP